jgi:hypothetical protein
VNILKNSFGMLFLFGTGITAASAGESSAVPNKWQYNLFNPTPRLQHHYLLTHATRAHWLDAKSRRASGFVQQSGATSSNAAPLHRF